ncbi:MAG: methylated-DNA--[protein]-cysteine S-methyltransferase [Candidatus Heteroscillospira sp.]|jgi:methylated-DNA-[protein]-cysteine S-methyltransferase
MQYMAKYQSPMGQMLMASDGDSLTGLWFEGAKYFAAGLSPEPEVRELPAFEQTGRWLDLYFSGREPDFTPPIRMAGTPFQLRVWEELQKIPRGGTVTYGELARLLGVKSAQAVGGAVGRNRISIVIPCHRVVGAGGLTGYAGGVDKKRELLRLEGARYE